MDIMAQILISFSLLQTWHKFHQSNSGPAKTGNSSRTREYHWGQGPFCSPVARQKQQNVLPSPGPRGEIKTQADGATLEE